LQFTALKLFQVTKSVFEVSLKRLGGIPSLTVMELPQTKTIEEAYEVFKVSDEEGLSVERVTKLREQYGPNGMLLWLTVLQIIVHPGR